ncbi:CDP-glycerol glycerophosphotransferase [Macrococcoides caseolyticum subsp. hominis]|uniref:CDP-glycerol glycerophosphotransferase family protein n=1 Tax=Macrococcoides caseolyticum TaxID=69966 RepID=UPI000C15C97F|nr:CDP-glycerol glycerophosphotransferase family protein [Macrococcus caseolyticus]RAI83451.1 CDP-glycerol glycerophosphotransferase [Macrococcus caseolyticus subsp. hominis]
MKPIVYNFKKYLRKQLILNEVIIEENKIKLFLTHKNFYFSNLKQLKIKVDESFIKDFTIKEIKNQIQISFDISCLKNCDKNLKIELFSHKNKKLWIQNGVIENRLILYKNRIIKLRVDKNIYLDYINIGQNYNGNIKEVNLYLKELNLFADSNFEIQKFILIDADTASLKIFESQNNGFSLGDVVKTMKRRSYCVFIMINNEIFICNSADSMDYNYEHNQIYISKNVLLININYLLTFDNKCNYFLGLDDLSLNGTLDVPSDDAIKDVKLVNDQFDIIDSLKFKYDEQNLKYNIKIPLSIIKDTADKFFVVTLSDEKQYILKSKNKIKFKHNFVIENEYFYLSFRTKGPLKFLYEKPRIQKKILGYNDKGLNLLFNVPIIYSDCEYFLSFEERESQEAFKIPIVTGEQNINLEYENIINLTKNNKFIVDIFVNIAMNGQIIRKEKLRLPTATYKKDNYLTKKVIVENDFYHYIMMTLTPFKNIKLEVFSLDHTEFSILNNSTKDYNVWLIGERKDTAQDNGIVFFQWLMDNTEIEAYYVIDSDSKDYDSIKHKKNVLVFGSLEHFKIAATAGVLICTHDLENILPYKTNKDFFGYQNTIKVFLQHGVLGRKNVEYHKWNYEVPFDLFNVSSKPEKYDIVVNQMGYKPDEVAITGLPRFDRLPLENNKKDIKKILIMPTWRDWLNNDISFNNSEYLEHYINLISNKQIINYCKENHIDINFYPHYRSQEFFRDYIDRYNLQVNFIELGQRTVQDLLIEHDILITDFSSVSFDFNYMNKPVIFYHFDFERFFRKGILRPKSETFLGMISYNEMDILNNIKSQVINKNNNYDYKNIFENIDHQNSYRVYKEILALINK